VVGLRGPLLLFDAGVSATSFETGVWPDLSLALRSAEYPAALLDRLAASGFRYLVTRHGVVETGPSYLSWDVGSLRRISALVEAARAAHLPVTEMAARVDSSREVETFAGSYALAAPVDAA
jgi:hypothetical protein